MAKIPQPKIRVKKPGKISQEDVLVGVCQICGCELETERKNTLLMRAPRAQDSVLCMGVECQTEGCQNWIVMAPVVQP